VNHTKGPWEIEEASSFSRFSKEALAITASPPDDFDGGWDELATVYRNTDAPGEGEDNAARIVACVNACDQAELSNEALDAGVLGMLLEVFHGADNGAIPWGTMERLSKLLDS